MTIRASLLWVLAFFSFMLVIGAALGVLSLRISNGTLAELKQSGTGRCARPGGPELRTRSTA